MRIAVGLDLAKALHWVTAVDETGAVRLDQAVPNDPPALDALVTTLRALPGEVTLGLDLVGGPATLVTALLLTAGFRLVHVPGLAVNRAREGTVGGERKSDPRDARVIAEQVRTRTDLRPLDLGDELTAEIRLLVARRRDLTADQTRRLARLHDLLATIHPGLERRLDLTTKGALWVLTRYVTPGELRAAGRRRVIAHLRRAGHLPHPEALAASALAAAEAQRLAVPGEALTADLIRELATEALATRERLARLDRDLEARLARHPDAALIQSLPGMGARLTADLLATAGSFARFRSAAALAANAGLAPVVRQSGKSRRVRRARRGDPALKRVFYQAAFCALRTPESRAFYERKRREGKGHRQAVIALARRRIDVLWAILHSRQPFQPHYKAA
jgi:transposase